MSIFDLPEVSIPAPSDNNFGEALASAATNGQQPQVPMSGNRYSLPDADGNIVVWPGATTLAEVLDNPYPLQVHRERQVARGMAIRPDLCAMVAADPDNKAALKEVLREAKSAAAHQKEANWGTALHAVFKQYDEGVPIEQLPEMFHADIKARAEALQFHGITILPEYRERVVRCLSLRVSGRLDGIAKLPDGTLVIVDDKSEEDPQKYTSAKKIQLATYAYSGELMNYRTNELEPMPSGLRLDIALIIHTRPMSGKCTIYEVDITEGWAGAILARKVQEWRSREGGIVPYVTDRSWVPKESVTQQPVLPQQATHCAFCNELLCPSCAKCVSDQCPESACACQLVSEPGELELWSPQSDINKVAAGFNVLAKERAFAAAVQPEIERMNEQTRQAITTAAKVTPAIDPQTEAEELIKELKLDKPGWKAKAASVGVTDLNHHIRDSKSGAKGLAHLYVTARNSLGMDETQWRQRQNTRALEPEAYTKEQVIADLNSALTKDQLRNIYDKWVAVHGTDAWSGEVLAAGVDRMNIIRGATTVTTHPLA